MYSANDTAGGNQNDNNMQQMPYPPLHANTTYPQIDQSFPMLLSTNVMGQTSMGQGGYSMSPQMHMVGGGGARGRQTEQVRVGEGSI